MDKVVEQKVIDYVLKNYTSTFEKKTPIVTEHENHFRVYSHKDGSPIILGKSIINK